MAWFAASTISAPLAGCEQAARIVQKATSEVPATRLPAVCVKSNTIFPAFFLNDNLLSDGEAFPCAQE
eukprot:9544-Heterococcus_DN1.PRE.1